MTPGPRPPAPTLARAARGAGAPRLARALARVLACAWLAAAPFAFAAGPVVWDEDEDGIDDRIGTVQLLGWQYSFENADSLARQRFEVARVGGGLVFGIYVRYQQAVSAADLAALTALGVTVQHRLLALPAVRARATAAQASLVRALPGVTRIEVVPLLYPASRDGRAAIGADDPTSRIVPTVEAADATADGRGVVVAILDSGVNDAPSGFFPGHEALAGRCLGGADFTSGDSLLDTPRDGSENPVDPAAGPDGAHGTHVASIVLGSGGASGFARGVAPGARFVDVRVLGGSGAGSGVPEGLDWCIANRTRDWGSPDTSYRGIDVINLSLSSLDRSEGSDIASALCDAAAAAGIVVVAAIGNDGHPNYVPSPAASDAAIAVGSFDAQRSADPSDDLPVAAQNRGPRDSDGDADAGDELRPTLLAPGVAVLAANGDLATDGTRYVRRSGTSMACAFVTGAVARLRSIDPSLAPSAIASLLRATARRAGPGVPPGVPGPDPRWAAERGFGVLDAWGAATELADSNRTQLRRFTAKAGQTDVTAEAWTQRERGAAHLVFERADDAGGLPGPFAALDSVATTGDGSLADGDDTAFYTRTWPVPPGEYGIARWYRVAWTESGVRTEGPAVRVDGPSGPAEATIVATVVHDAYDTDVDGTAITANGAIAIPLPGSSAAVATDWVDGTTATGTIAQTFHVPVPQGPASAWLPPSALTPWTLELAEGGFLNRSGRLAEFRIVWHSAAGDLEYTGNPLPVPTLEGGTVESRIPLAGVGVEPGAPAAALAAPNPVRSGGAVTFSVPRGAAGGVDVFDLAGRRVGGIAAASPGATHVRWSAVDAAGRPLRAGVYLARLPGGATVRLAVVR